MKQCPTCGAYYDDGRAFCVHDGAALMPSTAPPSAPSPGAPSGLNPKGLLAVIGVLVVVVAGLLVRRPAAPASTAAPSSVEEEPAWMPSESEPVPEPMPEPMTMPPPQTRYVNSPGDGFLALRSAPSSRTGTRLARIPHGAAVDLLHCDGPEDITDGDSGRWCAVRYGTREGWSFDAYLVRSEAAVEARVDPVGPPEDARLRRVVDQYLSRQSTNDIAYILGLYAAQVRYYDWGWVGHDRLRADKSGYFGRWPSRTYVLDSPVRTVVGSDGVITIRFTYRFTVRSGTRARSGRAWAELDVHPSSFLIRGERGDVL